MSVSSFSTQDPATFQKAPAESSAAHAAYLQGIKTGAELAKSTIQAMRQQKRPTSRLDRFSQVTLTSIAETFYEEFEEHGGADQLYRNLWNDAPPPPINDQFEHFRGMYCGFFGKLTGYMMRAAKLPESQFAAIFPDCADAPAAAPAPEPSPVTPIRPPAVPVVLRTAPAATGKPSLECFSKSQLQVLANFAGIRKNWAPIRIADIRGMLSYVPDAKIRKALGLFGLTESAIESLYAKQAQAALVAH